MKLTCYPSLEQFSQNAALAVQKHAEATHIAMSCSLDLDCANPVSILKALEHEQHFFLLENATAEKTIARYSFFGYQMEKRFRCYATEQGGAEFWLSDYRQQEQEQCLAIKESLEDSPDFLELLFQYSSGISLLPIEVEERSAPCWQGFQGGLVGMFSYEAVRHMEVLRQPLRQLSTHSSMYGQQPEMLFYEVQRFFVIDNAGQRLFAVYLQPLPPALERNPQALQVAHQQGQQVLQQMVADLGQKLNAVCLGSMLPHVARNDKQLAAELSRQLWQEDQTEDHQHQTIEQLREELIAGEALQVGYSVGRRGPRVEPSLFYRLLRRQNPSPYMYFFKDGEQHLVGSSPETHLRYQDNLACIKPIAGTRPLGENLSEAELQSIIADLLQDPKERAEHLMLVDLARNDLYTNCQYNSVRTVKEFAPEVYSHVVHIVSQVEGRLRPDSKPYELFAKTFPAGTLSGAPKVRAIELIDQYEQSPRGFYGGCIGYFNYDGCFDSAIIIRSAWIDDKQTLVRSGGGLVYDSNSTYEICEHRQKLGVLSSVLQAILND